MTLKKKISLMLGILMISIFTEAMTIIPNDTMQADKEVFVYALSGLKLRYEPSFHADVITILEYGEELAILEALSEQDAKLSNDWTKGKWVEVSYLGGIKGYVYDGYLSDLPLPEVDFSTSAITSLLERYAVQKLGYIGTDTTNFHTEMDENFHVRYTHLLSGNSFMRYDAFWDSEKAQLELTGVRIMDAYHLVRALLTASGNWDNYSKEIIFKEDVLGDIYEIKTRYSSGIKIRKLSNGNVRITFNHSQYLGC
jgi:hypothetical protein